jgi:hypothetical protein
MFNPNESLLAGTPRQTLQQWLREAQHAYHELMTGGKPVTVSYDGKSTTFQTTDSPKLASWIALLQAQLGMRTHRRQALRPYFR